MYYMLDQISLLLMSPLSSTWSVMCLVPSSIMIFLVMTQVTYGVPGQRPNGWSGLKNLGHRIFFLVCIQTTQKVALEQMPVGRIRTFQNYGLDLTLGYTAPMPVQGQYDLVWVMGVWWLTAWLTWTWHMDTIGPYSQNAWLCSIHNGSYVGPYVNTIPAFMGHW